jgi:hypothetical protein
MQRVSPRKRVFLPRIPLFFSAKSQRARRDRALGWSITRTGVVTNRAPSELGRNSAKVLRGSACRFVPEVEGVLSTIAVFGYAAQMSSGIERVVGGVVKRERERCVDPCDRRL